MNKNMLTFIFIFLILEFHFLLCSLTENVCSWRIKYQRDNNEDIPDGCLFFLYASLKPYWKHDLKHLLGYVLPPPIYQVVLALTYAIEEINRNPNLLPNISLGFYFMGDRCDLAKTYKVKAMEAISQHLLIPNYMCGNKPCVAMLIETTWATSARLASFLQLFSIPQVTYGPYDPFLSDDDQFPYLHQVAPKDTSLPLAIVSLMAHFSWTWVGLVISDNDKDIQFLSDLREEMQRNENCLAFVNVVPGDMQLYKKRAEIYYNQIITSSVNVVIIYGDINNTLFVSSTTWKYLLSRRIWITTSQWDFLTSKRASSLDPFYGTFTFAHHHGEMTGFKKLIQKQNIPKFPENILRMKLGWMCLNFSVTESNCQTQDNLSSQKSLEWLTQHTLDMAMSDTSYNIYNAAYAIAHSLHKMLLQQVDMDQMILHGILGEDCRKLQCFLKNIQFTNPVGDLVKMNQKGKFEAEYDIFNLWDLPESGLMVKIGQFSPHFPHGQQLHLFDDMIEWITGNRQIPQSVCSMSCSPGFRKSHQTGKTPCCFDCTHCPVNEISNETDIEQCVKCPDDQYANVERTHCLQRAVTFLAYEDPLGMALACTALCLVALTATILGVFVKHHDTPIVKANNRTLSYILLISLTFCFLCSLLFIGHPNTATCILQQTTFGVVFTVAVSTVLAKTVTVVLAFKATAPGRRIQRVLASGAPNFIIPFCTLIQLTLCGIWVGTSPPFVDRDAHYEHGHIIITCNKASVTAFYCVLGFLGSLALMTFTVSFLARNLPETFNDAKFLTYSMLVFCSVWVTFLPVYHSTKGKFMVAVEVFSILTSSAGMLGCIFVPKCYIILLRPGRNSYPNFRNTIFS